MIQIIQAETDSQIEQARNLFLEYERWLGLDLCFQGFEEELRGLPGKYAKPDGRLLIAYSDEALSGCIALRKIEEGVCEMKRFFVNQNFRGSGLGNKLLLTLIDEARIIGYDKIRLDTYEPKMSKAVKLYRSHGFYEIPAYYDSPHEEDLYLELKL